jgi:hypothetical protein
MPDIPLGYSSRPSLSSPSKLMRWRSNSLIAGEVDHTEQPFFVMGLLEE